MSHRPLIEGKTKKIVALSAVRVVQKDDITAGDGAKHDILPGKARHATTTTSNVFRLLRQNGLEVAFYAQDGETSFIAPRCTMLPFEVVVRREAHGSYCKRHANIEKGTRFNELLVELYLKTSSRRWGKLELECDDPLIQCSRHEVRCYNPSKPWASGTYFLRMDASEVYKPATFALLPSMAKCAKEAFLILEREWLRLNHRLVDYKVEFGIGPDGTLLLADVIDNDSWRLIVGNEGNHYVDKQVYRDGGTLDSVIENYQRVAEMTASFGQEV